jgi:AcrR family transcriptional regulator
VATEAKRGGKPAPKRVPRAVREQEMLEVAERVFAEHGYDGASMDEIARGAGISKPMVYSYFGSKEGLYLALVRRATDKFYAWVEEASSSGTAEERLWGGIKAYFRFVEEYRWGWTILYREAAAGPNRFEGELEADRGRVIDLLARLMIDVASERGVDDLMKQQIHSLTHAFVGAAEGLGRRWLDHPDEPRELQELRLMNFAWLGFKDLLEGELWVPEED